MECFLNPLDLSHVSTLLRARLEKEGKTLEGDWLKHLRRSHSMEGSMMAGVYNWNI